MKRAGVVLTTESIAAAREWFADNARACAAAARSRDVVLQEGEFHVNDLERYQADQRVLAEECLAGVHDHTFAFLQKAHFIQIGECVALLPGVVMS